MKLTEQESLNLQSNIETLSEGNPDHPTYRKRVRKFFNLNPITISEKKCYYLAGFIEGEGSISISAKKNQKSRFLTPAFFVMYRDNSFYVPIISKAFT